MTARDRLARVASVLALSTVGLVLMAAPARAHGSGQGEADAAYYRTELTEVTPAVVGVAVAVDPGGEWISLANTGSTVVVVLGYTREPYLRITATSTEENQRSQTAVINRALAADAIPSGEAPPAAPEWKQTATIGAVRWHDHRIRWNGRSRPREVAADPTRPRVVGTWTVRATADGAAFEIRGTLSWLGRPNTATLSPWFVALLSPLVVVILVAGWHLIQRRESQADAT